LQKILIIFFTVCFKISFAQNTISGTVFDSTKINYVPGVKVVNNAGQFAYTDSMGRYRITIAEKDSLTFIFNGKSTIKFATFNVNDPRNFDITLHVPYKGKYKALKEVIVFTKSFKEDSIENRQTYAKIFDYEKPGLRSSVNASTGMVGADVNELINLFRFKRNKRLRKFQLRLEEQEQEKYINYRFSKIAVKRITNLQGEQLALFMLRYRPTYEFVSLADEVTFNQHVLNCYYRFQLEQLKKGAVKL
jgi:hypothetical protein